MGRPRKHPETTPEELMKDTSMADVTDLTLPGGVPRNPDGTPKLEGEVEEFQVQKIGALDVESAQRNKTVAEIMRDVKLGKPVRWNTDDAMEMFFLVRQCFSGEWGSMHICVSRDDPPAQFSPVLGKQMNDASDLYRWVQGCHGKMQSAKYTVYYRLQGNIRGKAHIDMPDTSDVQVVQPSYGQPSYGQPPQPPPYGYQGQGGGWQAGGQPAVVVVRDPPAPPPMAAPPPAPVPAPVAAPPVHHHYPAPSAAAPASISPELAQVLAQVTQSNAMMLDAMKEIVAASKKPPGFIALPEGHAYPIPQGYLAVPGGMIPNPMGLGQAPAVSSAPPPTAGPGAFAGFAAQQAAPAKTVTEADQIGAAIKGLQTILDGAKKIESMLGGGAGDGSEEPATPDSPRLVQDVGGLQMIIDRATGKTSWAETMLGALPKLADAGKTVLGEFQKTMEKQAALTSRAVAERVNLADHVAVAARAQAEAAQATRPRPAQVPARPAPPQAPTPAPVPQAAPARPPPPPPPAGPPVPTVPIL